MKKKRKILLTVTLILSNVLLWGLISYKVIDYVLSLGEEETAVEIVDETVSNDLPLTKRPADKTKIEYVKLERDPFRTYSKPVIKKTEKIVKKTTPPPKVDFHYKLNGIIENDNSRLAIFQDTKTGETYFLRTGESEGDLKVRKITAAEVEVTFQGGKKVISVEK